MGPAAARITGSLGDTHRLSACAVALLAFLAVSPEVSAADVDGGISLFRTATDNQGLGVDSQEVLANFALYQRFTPYVGARFAYLLSLVFLVSEILVGAVPHMVSIQSLQPGAWQAFGYGLLLVPFALFFIPSQASAAAAARGRRARA